MGTTTSSWRKGLAAFMASLVVFTVSPSLAQETGVVTTPPVPLELPVEVELELAPGSLKQAPLWHEIAEILEDPYNYRCNDPDPNKCVARTPRRPSFLPAGCSYQPNLPPGIPRCTTNMPRLNIWNPNHNVLTDQPLRYGISGEINWDQPGYLFGPDDGDPTTPVTEIIGALVVDADNNLVVSNPSGTPDLPADGFVVGTPAFNDEGEILDEDGEEVVEFETPISELDFLRPTSDTSGIPAPQLPYIGRPGAQALGKALFWDMQVGSDGVQACGSCHFHAGTDNRTKNQMNPNHLGGDHNFEVRQPNDTLVASDFPFHKLANPNLVGEPLMNPGNVVSDSNDVMSSMGVRFRKFRNIPPIGLASFGPPSDPLYPNVRPLLPDLESLNPLENVDPIAGFAGLTGNEFRRVEPRNTPTIFGVAFNFDNFWDGRARHDANGGSVFGPADPQFHVFIDPGPANGGNNLQGATNGHFRDPADIPAMATQPVRIRFSSLASLATGPALSDFEMSFAGRNWPKVGKKLLQVSVTPLANQLVDPWDSLLGPFSNQRATVNGPINRPGRPGLNVTYNELIRLAFKRQLWHNSARHLRGVDAVCTGPAENGQLSPPSCDPFDGFKLVINNNGAADPTNRNQFTQMEANFSLFFGLSLQIWQEVLIPDNTPFDRFFDMNPLAANGVAQPGELNVLHPSQVRQLVTGSPTGQLNMPANFGPEELFGFDIFAGANLTAALPVGSARNPTGMGSNPFHRTARCMICHIGPEQTDHTNNVNAGLLLGDTEYELPAPGEPEPTGPFRLVTGIGLAEEVEENAQDGVEVENRNFALKDDLSTPWDEGQIGTPSAVAFQDNGVYNIGVRPTTEDIMRGGDDAFGWPLSLAAMAMKNLGGEDYEPCDDSADWSSHPDGCEITHVGGGSGPNGLFEETGADQRVNPGLEMEPGDPELPPYLAPWANNLPAGEGNPLVDELAFAPNTVLSNEDPVFGGTVEGPPAAEFDEILFGSDYNCGLYDPSLYGNEAPNFGWGPTEVGGPGGCPNSQSAIPVNSAAPRNGTYPFPNRVARMGAVKAPQLRNVELTGPYFHTGSYLTLRQVVDFYMRGGDFPITNGEDRDPNMVNMSVQAFGFGTTIGLPPEFQDGVPDLISQYGFFPDGTVDTPEPPNATPEAAKEALVKFLLALTDRRVAREMAPFDHPEVFIPLDGRAPDNTFGRTGLLTATVGPCLGVGTTPCFRQIPAVGAGGNAAPLPNFLGISSNPTPGDSNDHFDR